MAVTATQAPPSTCTQHDDEQAASVIDGDAQAKASACNQHDDEQAPPVLDTAAAIAATKVRLREIADGALVEEVKERSGQDFSLPSWITFDMVTAIVRAVHLGLPMEDSAGGSSLTSLSGLDSQTVLDVIAGFGSFLCYRDKGRTSKAIASVPFHKVAASGLVHFEGSLLSAGLTSSVWQRRVPVFRKKGQPAFRMESVVVLPEGVARQGRQRRDVTKSYAMIAVTREGIPTAINQWLARNQPVAAQLPVGWCEVSYVWFITRLGFVTDLAAVCEPELKGRTTQDQHNELARCAARARQWLSAIDVLETRLEQAQTALETLTGAWKLVLDGASPKDLGLGEAITAARWVNEAEFAQLSRVLDGYTPSRARLLAGKLRALGLTVAASNGHYVPAHIGQLTDAQVLRLAQACGLDTSDTRALADEVRDGLSTLGLAGERSRLVPEGVSAIQAGIGDAFWASMRRLADNDPLWREDLDEARGAA